MLVTNKEFKNSDHRKKEGNSSFFGPKTVRVCVETVLRVRIGQISIVVGSSDDDNNHNNDNNNINDNEKDKGNNKKGVGDTNIP